MARSFAHREVSRKAKFRARSPDAAGWSAQHRHMKYPSQAHLQAHRKMRKYSQKAIALELGIAHNTVSGWETGARAMDMEDLEKLAKLYGVHPSVLLLAPEHGPRADAMREAAEIARTAPERRLKPWLDMGKTLDGDPAE